MTHDPDAEREPAPPDALARFRQAWPFVLLVFALCLFFGAGLDRYLTFDALKANRAGLQAWVAANGWLAPVAFALVYAAATALSVPAGALLTIAGGFLFGLWTGTAAVVIGATAGATLLFLAARSAFHEMFARRFGERFAKLERGFREDAFSYLLTLRLLPIVPFWLANLAPAFLGMRLAPFVAATALGIVPGTFVYVSVGAGLGAVFDAGQTPDLRVIFKPEILLPIVGLAILSLLPVAARRLGWTKRHDA